ncbi:MAG: RidA family protein [Gammaproteobacteria bacterium]|nr:MAG: RidA family protein [Gammaproteobacteria bacterium]
MDLFAQGNGCRARLLAGAALVMIAGCQRSSQPYEYIHLPGTEPASGANMPFTSAIRVRSGSILFLSGTTGAPVPHSHPHVPAEFDHLDFSAEAQTIRVMERLKTTLEAAGGQLSDIIQVTRFIVDVANNQDAINVVMNRYWGDDHRPASTSVEIVRLATDPRFILEVEAVAVLSD